MSEFFNQFMSDADFFSSVILNAGALVAIVYMVFKNKKRV